MDQTPSDARLVVTAYTGYRLMINGVNVVEDIGPWAKWTHPESVNVAPLLKKGNNVIAAWIQVLEGQNVHAIPEHKGFALALAARDPDGRSWHLVSDASWKGSAEEHPGWDRPELDDSAWNRGSWPDGKRSMGPRVAGACRLGIRAAPWRSTSHHPT